MRVDTAPHPIPLPMLCRLQFDMAWGEGDWAASGVGLRAVAHTPLDQPAFTMSEPTDVGGYVAWVAALRSL
jgi:hypothetical protein